MRRSASLAVGLSLTLCFCARLALAGGFNRLVNGDFDSGAGVSGWLVADPAASALEWVPGDFDGCSLSGSARFSNSAPGPLFWASIGTCAVAAPGEIFGLSLQARFLSGTAASVFLAQVTFRDGPDCAGSSLWSGYGLSLSSEVTDWTGQSWPGIQAPEGTQSVAVDLILAKEAGGGLAQLELDRVLLTAGDAPYLFADGFESGETCRWNVAP